MKIGFLTSEYPHPQTSHSGGIGTSIKSLSQGLKDLGHEITIFLYGQKSDSVFVDHGVNIITIKNPYLKGISWLLLRNKIQKTINTHVQEGKLDILEVVDWTGISAFMQLQCPVIMRLHGSDSVFCNIEHRKVKRWNKFIEKRAFLAADKIIAVSKFIGDQTNKTFNTNRQFKVIYNGIDTNLFPMINSTICDTQTILYFGTLIRKKGVLEIPHIFNQIIKVKPSAKLVLIGNDAFDIQTGNKSTWNIMKPLFSKEALPNVFFMGKVNHSEMSKHIKEASVCIFPSYAEAFPISWLEAMSMGKALVTSNIGWANEIIIENENGFMAEPSNHSVFASKIIGLLNDEHLNKRIAVAAHQTIIARFSASITAEQSINIYASFQK